MFFYEKWDVYNAAVRLREIAQELTERYPRGASADLDQFRRASSSVLYNLCEGARELHFGKKIERYATSCSSASECNGCLRVLRRVLPASSISLIDEGQDLANRIAAMMTNLIRNTQRRQQEDEEQKRRGRDTKGGRDDLHPNPQDETQPSPRDEMRPPDETHD